MANDFRIQSLDDEQLCSYCNAIIVFELLTQRAANEMNLFILIKGTCSDRTLVYEEYKTSFHIAGPGCKGIFQVCAGFVP